MSKSFFHFYLHHKSGIQFGTLKNHQKNAKFWFKMKKIDFSFLVPHFLMRNFSYSNSSISRFSQGTTMRTTYVIIDE